VAGHHKHPLGHRAPRHIRPFSVFLLTKYMRRIPYSLIEAAKMEGRGSGTSSPAYACPSAARPHIP
jgi:ABC-type glycerol-3-phosphate transport system permease component